MTDFTNMAAAVVGTGFIGSVHLQALRRMGVNVRGVLGSSPERGQERAAALGVAHAYETMEALLADDTVEVVHVTSPNHAHFEQVKTVLAAGKHVICEKPLSMTSAQSAEMKALAEASGKVCAVCYNIRFYPLNQHAHAMVRAGELGDVRFVTGHYHQDWLAKQTDWNWRLQSDEGGALRSVGDIGTHWADLTTFVTGLKPVAVFAELSTFIEQREKPKGPVETFSGASGETELVSVDTDDAAMIIIRYENGARGVMSTSQINMGRKNSLQWDVAGSTASAAWDSEKPDHMFIGHRDKPNETLMRDFTLMNETGTALATMPPGHVEGFGDTFYNLFRAAYADVAAGGRQPDSTWATFADGHDEMVFCEAVLKSAQSGGWVELSEV